MPLDYPATCGTAAFHNAPVAVFFTILETRLGSEKHAGSVGKNQTGRKDQGRHYRRFSWIIGDRDLRYQPLTNSVRAEIGKIEFELRKSG
jgi:hypothetical protein